MWRLPPYLGISCRGCGGVLLDVIDNSQLALHVELQLLLLHLGFEPLVLDQDLPLQLVWAGQRRSRLQLPTAVQTIDFIYGIT